MTEQQVRLELLKIVYRYGVEPRLVIEQCEALLPFVLQIHREMVPQALLPALSEIRLQEV